MKFILITSIKPSTRETIETYFNQGFQIETAHSLDSCIEKCTLKQYEIIFIDINHFRQTEDVVIHSLRKQAGEADIVIMADKKDNQGITSFVQMIEGYYYAYPITEAELRLFTERAKKRKQQSAQLRYLKNSFWHPETYSLLRTNSPLMKETYEKIRMVAPTDSIVLLNGETGVGKGIIAKLIHDHSQRSAKMFLHVHCGAIPETLLESELFGHEKGAFTGAIRKKLGKVEIAQNGSLFLDEIGTISQSIQIKLLQVLQERIFYRVGGEQPLQANVRYIFATNENLLERCEAGTFREDLFYRMNVFPIEIPPLRKRLEDIPLLVEAILEKLNRYSAKKITRADSKVLNWLYNYRWPGNIRELENIIERAFIIENEAVLTESSIPMELKGGVQSDAQHIDTAKTLDEVRQAGIESIERGYLIQQLSNNSGKINQTAEASGIGVRQLHKLLTKHNIDKSTYKN